MVLAQTSLLARGGFSYRRYRRSPRAPLRGGRKKNAHSKKKKKFTERSSAQTWNFLRDRVLYLIFVHRCETVVVFIWKKCSLAWQNSNNNLKKIIIIFSTSEVLLAPDTVWISRLDRSKSVKNHPFESSSRAPNVLGPPLLLANNRYTIPNSSHCKFKPL